MRLQDRITAAEKARIHWAQEQAKTARRQGQEEGFAACSEGKTLNDNPYLAVGDQCFFAHGWKEGWTKRFWLNDVKKAQAVGAVHAMQGKPLFPRIFYDTSIELQAAYNTSYQVFRGLLDMGFPPNRVKAIYEEFKHV